MAFPLRQLHVPRGPGRVATGRDAPPARARPVDSLAGGTCLEGELPDSPSHTHTPLGSCHRRSLHGPRCRGVGKEGRRLLRSHTFPIYARRTLTRTDVPSSSSFSPAPTRPVGRPGSPVALATFCPGWPGRRGLIVFCQSTRGGPAACSTGPLNRTCAAPSAESLRVSLIQLPAPRPRPSHTSVPVLLIILSIH